MYALTEKISYIFLFILGLWLLGKHGRKIFLLFSGKTEESDGHSSLDKMIRDKKLSLGATTTEKLVNKQPITKNKANNSFTDKLQYKLLNNPANSEKISLEYLLNVAKELEWGEGNHIAEMTKRLNTSLVFPVTAKICKKIFEKVFDYELFSPFPGTDRVLPMDQLKALIKCYSHFYLLKNQLILNRESLEQNIYKMKAQDYEKVIIHFILSWKGVEFTYALKKIAHNKNSILEVVKNDLNNNLKTLLLDENNEVRAAEDILSVWQKVLTTWKSLAPLSFNPERDSNALLDLISCNKNDPWEKIKKSYNNEIRSRHPDRFSSYQLSTDFEKIITQNFQSLQSGFNELKSKYNK